MIRLKYPVFIFTKDDPMVYVFHNDYDFRVTTSEYVERTNVKNDMFIDSSGMKYWWCHEPYARRKIINRRNIYLPRRTIRDTTDF